MNIALGSYELSLFLKAITISDAPKNVFIDVIFLNPFFILIFKFLSLMSACWT